MGSLQILSEASLASAAKSLIKRIHATYHDYYGLSTTSCQVYDTAWVAMVAKEDVDGARRWLLPESFYYLLETQSEDGSWGAHAGSKTAGILDTAAALLALIKHHKEPLQIQDVSPSEVLRRINSASHSLRSQLATWDDVSETNHIGVELIVPALLFYLSQENAELTFDFPCKSALDEMHLSKLSRFQPESLYGKKPSSVLHSLEAFFGKIDFDRISHHLYHGSMLASPSSTAAYLMKASRWDEEAEKYLRHISVAGSGHGNGGIPGTYPTTHFEISWPVATLIKSGFVQKDLECAELQGLADILVKAFEDERGIIGFAPRAPDADDTAKALIALGMVGRHVSPEPMITVFEKSDHFATFGAERDPSFTSNCHVLLALLHQSNSDQYYSQILKATEFCCQFWWTTFHIKDKWHLSHMYPTMLLIEAFTKLLEQLDNGSYSQLAGSPLHRKVAICLFQACYRTLLSQQDDGSWNGSPEATCYGMLSLVGADKSFFFKDMRNQLKCAFAQGMQFLKSRSFRCKDQNWTSKTTYQVSFVAEAYELAALRAGASQRCEPGTVGHTLPSVPSVHACVGGSGHQSGLAGLAGFAKLAHKAPLFAGLPEWQMQASLLESALFVPLLRADRLKIYARDDMPVAEDKYVDIIPFTWVGCNNRDASFPVSTSILYEMMLLSLIGYQTDEFFESVAAPAFTETARLHEMIDRVIDSVDNDKPANGVQGTYTNGLSNDHPSNGTHGTHGTHGTSGTNGSANGTTSTHLHGIVPASHSVVEGALTRFAGHVLKHDSVLTASAWDRATLRRELRTFLHAHTTQAEENARFASQGPASGDVFTATTRPFFQWVRTTAADHVACAYSFAFACCLVSASSLGAGAEVFPTVAQKYLGAAAARHLTTACRMYNDVGSVARDTAERNVNSVHFPEFGQLLEAATNAAKEEEEEEEEESVMTLAEKRSSLMRIAEYEDSCLASTLQSLAHEISQPQNVFDCPAFRARKMSCIRFYCDVTAFYNQLYVLKDLSSSMQ